MLPKTKKIYSRVLANSYLLHFLLDTRQYSSHSWRKMKIAFFFFLAKLPIAQTTRLLCVYFWCTLGHPERKTSQEYTFLVHTWMSEKELHSAKSQPKPLLCPCNNKMKTRKITNTQTTVTVIITVMIIIMCGKSPLECSTETFSLLHIYYTTFLVAKCIHLHQKKIAIFIVRNV